MCRISVCTVTWHLKHKLEGDVAYRVAAGVVAYVAHNPVEHEAGLLNTCSSTSRRFDECTPIRHVIV